MEIIFTKMQGCGNDYIYINCFEFEIASPGELAKILSDRHFGIGGDGLVLITRSKTADAKMRMFNMDGSEGKMCGNAIRCVAKYLYDNGIRRNKCLSVETLSGIKELSLSVNDKGLVSSVKVNMGRAEFSPEKIPVKLQGESVVARAVNIGGEEYYMTCVSMGNPHAVIFYDNIDSLRLDSIGPLFENSALFPERVNTEFVEVTGKNSLKMRVWERGSGETLACGTGACAAAAAAVLNGYCGKGEDITVSLRGGILVINYTEQAVYMTGGCKKVFDGVAEI